MKIQKYSRIFTLIFLFTTIQSISAQECSASLFMKEGALLEYTNYNKKGKKISSSVHKTITVEGSNNDLTATIQVASKDEKNKETFSTDYKAYCKNGLFSVDMIRFFNYDKLAEYDEKNLAIEMDGDILEFPVNSNTGDELKDGSINIKLNNDSGFTFITLTFDIMNRKVIGKEKITTSAGTFECQKISFTFESKFGILKIRGTGVEWYYDDVVVVKSESYNKKGKLIGYHELTKME